MKNISLFFKDSKPYAQLIGLFFLLLAGMIMAAGLQALLPQGDGAAGIRTALLLQGVSQLLMFLLPAGVFAWLYHGSVASHLRLAVNGSQWALAGVGVVVFLLLTPANDWLTIWNDGWHLGPMEAGARRLSAEAASQTERLLSLTSAGDLALQLVVVAVVPAVCEELFFRSTLQRLLHQWTGNAHVAIGATALLFALAHGDLYGLMPRLLLGLLLGYLFYLSGSAVVNICAHCFNNALIVVLFYLYHRGLLAFPPTEPMAFSWLLTLACTLAAVALFSLSFVQKKESPTHPLSR